MKEEIQHLAKLAYQNGEKAMQKGWWPYVEEKAERLGIKAEVLTEIEKLKAEREKTDMEANAGKETA